MVAIERFVHTAISELLVTLEPSPGHESPSADSALEWLFAGIQVSGLVLLQDLQGGQDFIAEVALELVPSDRMRSFVLTHGGDRIVGLITKRTFHRSDL